MQKQKKRLLALFFVSLLALGILVTTNNFTSNSWHSPQLNEPQAVQAELKVSTSAEKAVPTPDYLPKSDAGSTMHKRAGTFWDSLALNNLPARSSPRKEYQDKISPQSVEELALDLGEIGYRLHKQSMTVPDNITSITSLDYLSYDIPADMKVLRLIDEAARDPNRVTQAVSSAINGCLDVYLPVTEELKQLRELIKQGRAKSVYTERSKDPYYAESKRYKDPRAESKRICSVVYCSFYVLANLNQLDRTSLAKWVALNDQQKNPYRNVKMDAWLIHQLYTSPQGSSIAGFREHNSLAATPIFKVEKRAVTAWDAPWDADDRMLTMMMNKPTPEDIRRVEVLRIPTDSEISDHDAERIIANFLGKR